MKLIGKTQKGKNVVQRDGSDWWICKAQPKVPCFNLQPGLLIAPVGSTRVAKAARWIKANNDPDFTLEKGE